MKITQQIVDKVNVVTSMGLTRGVGARIPGRMCVEAAICYALGEPHGDKPSCVAGSVRRFKIVLNDTSWSSEIARGKGLRRIAVAQLGSAGTIDEQKFVQIVIEQTIRQIFPIALRQAGLEKEAVRCEQEGTGEVVKAAGVGARWNLTRATKVAARAAAHLVGKDTLNAAAESIAEAIDLISDEIFGSGDTILELGAKICEQALIECGSPGAAFLD